MENLVSALGLLADLQVALWLGLGVLIGLIFGATPGLTATAGVAIATPLTFTLGFSSAMALLLGIYCAGYFAGSIPAILINTPGAPGNAASALGGHALARRGEADRALTLAILASVAGGLISVVLLALAAPPLARFALSFTSVEYFSLAVFGLLCVASVSGGSLPKAVAGAALGALLGTVGIDPVDGTDRFTFGEGALLAGIPLVPALIALFAVTEVLERIASSERGEILPSQQRVKLWSALRELVSAPFLVVKSGLIGTFIGMLPGTGPTIAAWIAYGEARRGRREAPPDGRDVLAPEVANNAVTGGALVPLLTLGIPGDTVTAVLVGALLIQGIEPGPFLLRTEPVLFLQVLVLIVAANLLMVALALSARPLFPLVLRVPTHTLVPLVLLLSAAGAYAVGNSVFDVALVGVLGVAAFGLRHLGFPVAPIVLGLVLGPIIETNFRNALIANEMDLTVFLSRPLSAILIAATLLSLFGAVWRAKH